MKQELLDKGFVVSPNNIHGVRGVLMYAGGPGILEPQQPLELQVTNDRIRLFKPIFFGEPYSRQSWWDTVTVAVFDTVQDFSDWLTEHGQPSKGGQCHYGPLWN